MQQRPRVILAICVGMGALGIISWSWTRTQPAIAAGDDQQHEVFAAPPTSTTVSRESTPRIVQRLSESFASQLQESHPELPDIPSLARDAESVYAGWMLADISSFAQLMDAKGAAPGPATGAIVNTRRAAYPDISAESWDAMTPEDRLRVIWERPEERLAGWHRVALDEIRTGIGWHGDQFDMGKATAGRYSVYEIEGRKQVFGEAMRGDRPAVWMVLPVEFNDGVWLETRLTWVWLDEARGWYPARIETLGSQARSCLMF